VKFTSKERDAETGLDYFGARYMSSFQGRFTSTDPVLISKQRIVDPQQWNLFGYVRNNPLKLVDPEGREVKVLDEAASRAIRSTVPESLRSRIKVTKGGAVDTKALNKVKTTDANLNDLRSAANDSNTIQVSTAKGFGGKEFSCESKEVVVEERAKESPDTVVFGREAPMDQFYAGHTEGREWTGKAATAPEAFRAGSAAHEIYGNGLPNLKGLPWKYDSGGPVDTNIKNIEQRTEKLYEKKP
jgi:RHS repeat-associated protein